MNAPESKAPERELLGTLANGLAVIKTFADAPSGMSLSDLAKKTGLTRASARRILMTLQNLGYVEAQGRIFKLRPKILELGFSYLSSQGWLGIVRPELTALAAATKLPCNAAVLEDDEVIYLDRVNYDVADRITMTFSIGQRFPAFVTALGRTLLGGMSDRQIDILLAKQTLPPLTPSTLTDKKTLARQIQKDRVQGWSFVRDEHATGLCSIAAPLIDARGTTFAAIGAGWLTGAENPEQVRDRLTAPLLHAVETINRALAQSGFVARENE